MQMTSIAERRRRNASPGDRRAIPQPIASSSLSDLWLVVQNHVQQGIMHFQCPVVFDEAQFAKLVHEEADARSGGADHLGERFLAELSHDRLRPAFLAEIC